MLNAHCSTPYFPSMPNLFKFKFLEFLVILKDLIFILLNILYNFGHLKNSKTIIEITNSFIEEKVSEHIH